MSFITVLARVLLPALVIAQLSFGAAQAQSIVTPGSGDSETAVPDLPDPLTEDTANALISRLSDSEVRALLLDQLNAQAVDPSGEDAAEIEDFVYHFTFGAFEQITIAIQRLPLLFTEQARAFTTFGNFVGANGLLAIAGYFVMVLIAAFAIEFAFRRLFRSWLVLPPRTNEAQSIRAAVVPLGKRLTSEVVSVIVFMVAASQITRYAVPPYFHPFFMLVGPWLIGLPRLTAAVGRFFMAPNAPDYRIVTASDATARAMVFHMFWLGMVIGIGQVIVPFNAFNGVPVGETRIGAWINFAVHFYVALLFWRYWSESVDMMRGGYDDLSPAEDWIARAYPAFGIIVAVATWWVVNIVVSYGNFALLDSVPQYTTMALLTFAPAMDTAIRGLVRHLAPPMTGEGPVAERAYVSTRRSYVRIGRVVVFGIVLLTVAAIWGMTPTTLASAGVGERVAAHLIEFLMILAIGYLVYEVVSLIINRKLAAEMTASGYDPENEEMGGGDGGGAGGSRLSTVLPLILGVSRAAIVVVFLLLGLSNIGVDTTPLLAGAGIVGLAIGFGAQKLVTDVVSGIFFLIDDAFRTGEYVEVDGTMGTVEKISIRSMQLRHHRGPVHTLPYGEIPKITNYSRDWVIMKLRFTVPFGTDPNKVKKIFKTIGAEMMEDPLFNEDFLQPFKSQGVLEFDDVGIVMRGKFMAKPGTQFTIRKELLTRVNKKFEEAGIDFARREVRVAIPGLDDHDKLTDEDKASIAAAASEAAQDMADTAAVGPGKPGD
ncbi:mechanosensitive ion channel family protein [uncultured Tateyamaria sp.]|uniref:mechanosensitive ion channel family protein n=1 Tax=uncultured Tateyamaria sp. TaxID=455651 RepID=UPI002601A451|nr:mechanosensitive ion channel family protein [uncultured Tateyamaria sp.]